MVGARESRETSSPPMAAASDAPGLRFFDWLPMLLAKPMPRPLILLTSLRLAGDAIAVATVALAACQKTTPTATVTADAIVVGGGTVNPTSAVTYAKGEISATWTMDAAQAGQAVVASAPGVSAVRVHATSLLPSDIIIAQGNNQSAKAGNAVTNSVVICVVGAGNVPMVGVPAGFQVTGGGGAISPQSAMTSSLGEVTAKWTLGTAVGLNTAVVIVSTISPASLYASGTP
jgi:hypothetical protein